MPQTKITDQNAVKFQRLIYGFLLLLAFIFEYMPLVVIVGLLMLLFLWLPLNKSPTYRLYYLLFPTISVEPCSCDSAEARFARGLGSGLLTMAFILNLLGISTIAWLLVLAVAVLSLIAGSTGFCLGNLIYAWLRQRS